MCSAIKGQFVIMLDFGWLELFLIMAVAVFVIGPDEIPVIMVTIGRIFRRFQYIKFAISQQFDDVMRDADLDDIRKSVNFEAKDSDQFDEAAADEEYATLPAEQPVVNSEVEQQEKGTDV